MILAHRSAPLRYDQCPRPTSPSLAAATNGAQAPTPHGARSARFGSVITAALYALASLGAKSKLPDHLAPFLGVVLGLSSWHTSQPLARPRANPVILPIAALLNALATW